jgi:5-methylcytosine-specific restriction endonuclease McrA
MPHSNPEKRKQYNQKYRDLHREELNAYMAVYRKENREEIVEYLKEWKLDNPDYDKQWRENNKDKKCKNQRNYRQKHPEKIRVFNAVYASKRTKAGGHFTEHQWLLLCKKYDYRCLCCLLRKKLTPDHVIPVSKGGTSNIGNIQPLCLSCNSSKNAKTIDYRKRKPWRKQSQKTCVRAKL